MATFEDKEIKRVLVIIAMEAEARPLFDSMHLAKVDVNVPFAAFEVHQGEHNGIMLTVVTNGKDVRFGVCNVGTTPGNNYIYFITLSVFRLTHKLLIPAALAAFYTIHETQPDLIINAGTAGGFKRIGAEIGDAFISTVCAHHDRRIVIPEFLAYGKGTHSSVSTKNLVQVLHFVNFVTISFTGCLPNYLFQHNATLLVKHM